jgi:energy-coupling factor transporter ATP-binding protein EcfA2
MAHGGVRLSRYEFSYTAPKAARSRAEPVTLSFVVEPESQPPTNIHVLIGRNGVGKTRLLNTMTRALVGDDTKPREAGTFEGGTEDLLDDRLFANLVVTGHEARPRAVPIP